MTIKDKWDNSGRLRFIGAVLLNALFLAALLIFIAPGFESNDDLTLAAFVDGQMAEKCAHIPYINYALALLLKGIYTVLGESAAWHTIGQYALMFMGFTGISWVLLRRLSLWQGAAASIVMLVFFGADAYTLISYTKTGSVAAVGGLLVMLCAMEDMEKGCRALPVIIGLILALFGFMLRFMEFLPCAALMAVLGLRYIFGVITEKQGERKLRRSLGFAAPFALLLLLAAGLYAVDDAAWSQGRWGEYDQLDATRIELMDYGLPDYDDMPEQYEALGLNRNAVKLFGQWNFWDPEVFSKDTMEQIIAAREEIDPPPSVGECLGKFLDKCITGFFVQLPVYGFLLMAVLWLACGEHDIRGWLTALIELGMFALFYLYLIWRGRYLVDRVDLGLFLAMFSVLGYTLKRERLKGERPLTLMVLALAIGLSFWLCRDRYRFGEHSLVEDRSRERQGVETILQDQEHLYLAKVDAVCDTIYSPLEPAGARYWDRIILLGGWDFMNPAIVDTLAKYGIENPYRDIVGNDRVYIIEDDIRSTMRYIHDYYDADASAELVEPVSSDTGLEIYRILD